MRVLFIDHPEADFLAAIVYLGLCQELGPENVIDWPWKHTFHGQTYEGPIPYPPPGDRGVASPFTWMQAQPGTPWAFDEVAARISEFDLVILAAPRAYSIAALEQLIARVGRDAIRKLVHLDGEDYTAIRWDLVERFRPSVYFKLALVPAPYEVYLEQKARMVSTVRVLPMPMASPLGSLSPLEKTTDVVFFGGANWRPHRREGVPAGPPQRAALEARLREEFPSFEGGIIGYDEYIKALRRARIAVCVGGAGLEPLRTYEILSCPDTLLARERIDVITPHPFVAGQDHVAFSDVEELVRVLKHYLSHEWERRSIASTGNEVLRSLHTPRARARQLLDEALR